MAEQSAKSNIATYKRRLSNFIKRNPYSELRESDIFTYVFKPWNDESLVLVLDPEYSNKLVRALNKLILPPRFAAIYHLDTNTMEYIYTILDKDNPCFSRQFDFSLAGKKYSCRFARSSDRLLTLAQAFARSHESLTDFRNLLDFNNYLLKTGWMRKNTPEYSYANKEPVSFYVNGFKEFNENEILEVSNHLSFFMQYYDRRSPYIVIHPEEREQSPRQLQFIETTFPDTISTRRQDPLLLGFALAAFEVESRLQFIYYYQILEYAAYYYLKEENRRQLLRIINEPSIHCNPDKCISEIIEILSPIRMEVEPKIEKVIKVSCSPDIIWKEVQQNIPYFSQAQEFDGGFVIEPFIAESPTLESFHAQWPITTSNNICHIRNALVHGREKKFGKVITPTPHNDILIRPWVSIARRISEQVIIFGEAST